MTRRKSVLKILSAVLAVLLLAVCFAGCGEYTPPENTGGSTPGGPPVVNPNPGGEENEDKDAFTVTLMLRTDKDETPFTISDFARITDLQAQWTEDTDGVPEVYRANFDKNGVAKVSGLDGDFKVTLVLTDNFKKQYCYDPNPARPERRDELLATNYKREVTVPLYKIQSLGESGNMNIGGSNTAYNKLTQTGAYSYTFKSRTDKHLFFYVPKLQGEYSFMTMMDVTADEINPKLDLHYGQPGFYVNPTPALTQDGGGAEGTYTKNVWLKYQVADGYVGNGLIFNLYSESEKPEAYPLTVYFIFERDGEYTIPKIESVEMPVTEDFTKTPSDPSGTLEFVSESDLFGNAGRNSRHILNQKYVKYNNPSDGGDGYYYYVDPATGDFFKDENGKVLAQYRLYAVINKTIPILRGMGRDGADAFLSYVELVSMYRTVVGDDGTYKNYYNFIMGSKGYSKYCNKDGAYPVNAELKQFLQDFAVSQRYFNDGNGHAEGMGVNSDEDSQWLFACAVYVK